MRSNSTRRLLLSAPLAVALACSIDQTTSLETDSGAALGGFGGGLGGSGGFPTADANDAPTGGTAGAAATGGVAGSTGGTGATGGVAGAGGVGGVAGSGGTTGWSPKSIPGCALWLDAADSTVFNAPAGAIQEWQDKCQNNHATGVDPSKPQLQLALQNGLPGARFDGIDDSLDVKGPGGTTGSYSLFFVVKVNQPSSQRAIWSNRGVVPTGATFFGVYNGKSYLYQNDALPQGLTATVALPTVAMLYELSVNAGARNLVVNGQLTASDAASASVTSVPKGILGKDQPNNIFVAMDVFEVIAFDQALSPADTTLVRTKLKEKWALP